MPPLFLARLSSPLASKVCLHHKRFDAAHCHCPRSRLLDNLEDNSLLETVLFLSVPKCFKDLRDYGH